MASIIEYPIALQRLQQQGLVCNYFNGGAFGFPKGTSVTTLGWISDEDWTIKPDLRPNLRRFAPPAQESLAKAAVAAWVNELSSPALIMPLSHWAFELDFGSRNCLPNLIEIVGLGLDPNLLAHRADASPIEFSLKEQPTLQRFVQTLLANLVSSDFMLAFPCHPILCTIHHHKQLWWRGSDKALIERISGYSMNQPL